MATDVAKHLTTEELEAGLDEIRRAPADDGTVELIVRRPAEGEREVLAEGVLDLTKDSSETGGAPTAARRPRTGRRTSRRS